MSFKDREFLSPKHFPAVGLVGEPILTDDDRSPRRYAAVTITNCFDIINLEVVHDTVNGYRTIEENGGIKIVRTFEDLLTALQAFDKRVSVLKQEVRNQGSED